MSEAALAALDGRVTNLETMLTQSLARIENLISKEISDLKNDQIKDLKEDVRRVERDLKVEIGRVADDQRRLWEATRALEGRENQRTGAGKSIGWLGNVLAVALSGGIGALLTYVMTGKPPHP